MFEAGKIDIRLGKEMPAGIELGERFVGGIPDYAAAVGKCLA